MKDCGPFAFTGLWKRWTAREGVEPASASVTTLPAVALSRAASQYDYIGSFREAIMRVRCAAMYLVDTNVLSAGAPGRRERQAAIVGSESR